jgi:hypothetical protein
MFEAAQNRHTPRRLLSMAVAGVYWIIRVRG